MDKHYVGEHLFPGQLGHFLVILAFVASLVAAIAYITATLSKQPLERKSWRRLGRSAFLVQFGCVFTIFLVLIYIIFHHYFEYQYVWEYTNRDLKTKFLLSSIWNGQEGSFLLWSMWDCILGAVLMYTSGRADRRLAGSGVGWEAPVMSVMSFAQFCLASMLLGIYFFGYKVGSSPFILFRQANPSMPAFQNANYLSFITDGRGLNPLLQNYWMTIHPPVLFCGFASTIVPFAYAFAGLWTKRFKEWVRPALPWAIFSAMVLGTGVMMGAAWAYETLTFGGFWAWDPVENAALVPWLLLVGGIHTMVVYRRTGHSLRSTFFFFISAFILVLYATFLTRSGILGTTSVHAFTDLGMSGQLLAFMFVFLVAAFALYVWHFRKIPEVKKEEAADSREFWMFIGALVLLLSTIFIMFSTSIPVWNKLFNLHMAPAVDQKFHYNKVQVFVAILVALGTALIQYLKYRKTDMRTVWKKIWKPGVIALILATLIAVFGNFDYWDHGVGFLAAIYILIYASVFAVIANAAYLVTELKGKMKNAGASIAHVGFGLMLLGIVISTTKRTAISHDSMGLIGNNYFPAGSEEAKHPEENVYLPRNIPMAMGKYMVTYLGDSTAPKDPKTYYKVQYVEKDSQGKTLDQFIMRPDAFVNPQGQEGLIANPDSKHYWNRDVFTYVTSVFDPSKMKDTAQYKAYQLQTGDTVFFSDGFIRLDQIVTNPQSPNYKPAPGDLAVGAKLSVHDKLGKVFTSMPIYYLRDSLYQYTVADTIPNLALYIRFDRILPAQKKIELQVKQSDVVNDYIVMKAYVFPFINILWIGTLIMILGFLLTFRKRVLEQRRLVRQGGDRQLQAKEEPVA
jgi:cytochrome c-type biogenesis protein CcmF